MVELRTPHTADLSAGELQAIRGLLDEAFDQAVTDDDHEHTLGGVHALIWEGRELIGHGSVVMRRLLHDGCALRTGYVESVAVRARSARSAPPTRARTSTPHAAGSRGPAPPR